MKLPRLRPDPTNLPRSPIWLIAAVSVWLAIAGNIALWGELNRLEVFVNAAGAGLAIGMGVMIASALAAVLSLFAWRWTLKPAAILLLLAAAMATHYMAAYRIVIDSTMLVNVAQTDIREARALLGPRLIGTVLILGVLPAWLVWRQPVAYPRWTLGLLRNVVLFASAAALLVAATMASFQPLSSTMRNHRHVRYLINPLNTLYAAGVLAATPFRRDVTRLDPIGRDARLDAQESSRPPLLLLVLGETGRSGNFGVNGYARPTTPELGRETLASFRNVWSCGTSTAASVPCMFSHLGREAFSERPHDYESLLDVLQAAGLAVLWLDNQAGCKGVCDRIPSVNTSSLKHPELCKDGECLDGILLEGLDGRIAALPPERRARGVVVVMHQMGSHGPAYWLRSPTAYKRFMPECTSSNLQDCSRESVVNAYDNTIAYTDHVLASAIGWLKTQRAGFDAAMVYVADHGESLGENNLYLHGLPYAIAPDVQKRVPWITWLSPEFEQRARLSTACLQEERDARLSHDNYFHSVLGLLHVTTALYQRPLDVYARCVKNY